MNVIKSQNWKSQKMWKKSVLLKSTKQLRTSDRQDSELKLNLGGVLQDVLQDLPLTTAGQTFQFVQEKKPKWNSVCTAASLSSLLGYSASTPAAAAILALHPPHPHEESRLYDLPVCLKHTHTN